MISFDDLIMKLKTYNEEEVVSITRAYEFAKVLHDGQFRQSGEPYISHPLNVAYILADMHADRDTVIAGLLHDTLEDTHICKKDIESEFGSEVAKLVDGVTKISRMNFSTKVDQNYANTRKIITGITDDVRIIIVKLADRLHNMRTLEFKSDIKQKENSLETMEIFVPLAYCIGAYRIKSELEDLSLRYLKPDTYKYIENMKNDIEISSRDCLSEMLYNINNILCDNNISNEIKVRTKNIYGIYKRLSEGNKISDIHDLLALKIMVDDISNCYRSLGLIHSLYHPINNKFKDYICNPKTNMYKSLHTTVFGSEDRLVQTQIRTFYMDKVASFGLTSYWDYQKGNARYVMQEELRKKSQTFNSLTQYNSMFGDNQEFVDQVKSELFGDKIYVYNSRGEYIELPKGATLIDYAYKLGIDYGNKLVGAYVNDSKVYPEYVLSNKDRINLICSDLIYGPKAEWENVAITGLAKSKIREFGGK